MDIKTTLYILVGVLTGGTLFAWYNVYLEYRNMCGSCAGPKENIFLSKCFWGAMFFTIALALAYSALSPL